ncbi:MAG: ribosome-associated translation inhibitor RaiA [Hyphomicrobiales bacterium]
MNLQITGKNLDVGQALRGYMSERIEQLVDKYVGRSVPVHIRMEKAKSGFRTDCSLQLWSHLSLESHGEAADPYASADMALERIDKRLRRYKRRLKAHHSRNREADSAALTAPYYVIQAETEDEEPAGDSPVVIAETSTTISEASVSEAVMQLDLSDQPFILFRNDGRLNVVYRRADGNVGWIDPEGSASNSQL